MANYRIIKELALINNTGTQQLRLNVIQWPGHAPKYDLRIWTNTWPSSWTPGKGLLLSEREARILCRSLEEDLFLSEPENPEAVEGRQEAQEGVLIEQAENPAGN